MFASAGSARRTGRRTRVDGASSLEDLAARLIKARIVRGWSQRQLADLLGVAEQQAQRYEATGYRSASLARTLEVPGAGPIIQPPATGTRR